MATPFPNEKPVTPHDLIELAEGGLFTSLDEAIDGAGIQLTRRDFDFTESGRASGHSGAVIARPRSGQGDHFACMEDDGDWVQNAGWDPANQAIDAGSAPQPALPPPPAGGGMTVSGGASHSPHAGYNPIRMTGSPLDVPPDVGNLGKGDGKEFQRRLDAMLDAAEEK